MLYVSLRCMKNDSRYQKIQREPEYLDSKGVEEIFGIKRSLCYELMKGDLIKSISLVREKDKKTRGKRLFEVKSIREYLKSQMALTKPITHNIT